MSQNVTVTKRSCTQRSSHIRVTKRKHQITLTTMTSLLFFDVYVLELLVLKHLLLETLTFSDVTLSDINVV